MKRNFCRNCSSPELNLIFDFGLQPLAGHFPDKPHHIEPCVKYALDLTQCGSCGLLMTTNLPPINEIFHPNYNYSSSTIPSLVNHFLLYSKFIKNLLPAGAQILEFGCNDGVLLDFLVASGFNCVGVDASENMANIAASKGHTVIDGFFNQALVLENGLVDSQDLITCSNVLAHVDDLAEVLNAVNLALKPAGLFCIEVHDAQVLVEQNQFDAIYHEHLTYFSSGTLDNALNRYGFSEISKEYTNMHGGGLRGVYKKETCSKIDQSLPVSHISGSSFNNVVKRCQNDIHKIYKDNGMIDGYGAAGRAQIFLNVTSTSEYFSCIFDDSRFRQNKFIAGTNLRIQEFHAPYSKVCIILAWNYSERIFKNISQFYDKIFTILPELTRLK